MVGPFWWRYVCTPKRKLVYFAVVGWIVLYVSVRTNWMMIRLRTPVFLLTPSACSISYTKSGDEEASAIIVYLSVIPFSSIWFSFMDFEVLLLWVYMFRIVISFLENRFHHHCIMALFIPGNTSFPEPCFVWCQSSYFSFLFG